MPHDDQQPGARLRHLFKWAAGKQLVPGTVHQDLATVAGLQKGRGKAPEPKPIGLSPTLPFVRPPVRAMVELQQLTGMRLGEVVRLRPCDLDTSGDVWLYRLGRHKAAHRGKRRVIPIGPRAQAILAAFTPPQPID